MKKMFFSFAVLLAMSVALISWNSKVKVNNAAVIDRDFGCLLHDGDGNLVFADASMSVITSSGNHNLRCSAQVTNNTGRAAVQSGFLCNAAGVLTEKSHSTVSASGQSTLICQAK